ncbi:MAG: zinc-dependent metalloprotease [Gemmatimonadetes bacterium]|nr:zinc-dependent metalloprotease [Gemmatimonadota bacterium]
MNRLVAGLTLAAALGCASGSGRTAPEPQPQPPQPLQPAAQQQPTRSAAQQQQPPQQQAAARPQSGSQDGLKPFAELTRGATARTGLFDSYQKGDHLYLAIPRDRLGRELILTFTVAQGIGARGIFGGTMLTRDANIVALERQGDRVFLLKRPHRFVAPPGSAVEKAVQLTFGASVLESARIESVREDSALVIDVHDWLVSDLSAVGERLGAGEERPGQPGRASFDRSRSYLEAVKSFPDNLNLRAKLTFRPPQPGSLTPGSLTPGSLTSVPDSRYVPVTVHYSLARLPERPMQPRAADDRVGYFLTAHKDFSKDEGASFFQRWINRWRLEPKDPAAAARGEPVEPMQPIVYHLDPGIPEPYRPAIKAGVEAWNRAFEAAGWRNAIRAEPLPEGADAEDLRYASIRWNTSDQPGYGAIGPSTVDPRTGEVLDADILMEGNMVLGFRRAWRTMVRPSQVVSEMLESTPGELDWLEAGGEAASLGAALLEQGAALRALLAAAGDIGPGDPVPAEYVEQALKWVTMHEVGHTLGLRHNFRSSSDTPLEKLPDAEWAEARGVFSSVMEYPAVNLDAKGSSGYFYNPTVGSYDVWAISYGYTPDDARAAALAREAARPGHAYGTDDDARGPGALDPTVNVYDLSADPLAWGKRRTRLLSGLWPALAENVLRDNSRYADVTDAFRSLLNEYGRALAPAVKYLGGQYHYRDHVGDPGGRAPWVKVPKAKQQEALEFLRQHAFGEQVFELPRAVLARFGANRWSHWGETNNFDGRIDYPFLEQVLELQRSLLEQMTSPLLFARIRDAELKYGPADVLTIPELLAGITRTVWGELWTDGARPIRATRRDLQRAYLDRMTEILVTPPTRMPADARAVARLRLQELDQRIARRLAAGAAADDYTRAHLVESRARIAKALEAGLEAERPARPSREPTSN